jgi:hypothetical protein
MICSVHPKSIPVGHFGIELNFIAFNLQFSAVTGDNVLNARGPYVVTPLLNQMLGFEWYTRVIVKSLKARRNHGFDLPLRKMFY